MKHIAVITSGGDAPGMNSAVRAAVRAALARGAKVTGFYHGYRGIIEDEHVDLDSKSVAGIINRGGTILLTARSAEFRTKEGRAKAIHNLKRHGIEGLVVIGGDGSLTGALKLHEEFRFPVMGVPGSIDNDIPCTDFSIGFDTANNTALEAIDRVRDTAHSHDRVFVIEVMGRANGFIALEVALSGGAEAALVPEIPHSLERICRHICEQRERGKKSCIIVVAEGAGKASDITEAIQDATGAECRYLVLGHMQRGGSPTCFDRVLGTQFGSMAANRLLAGYTGEMVGLEGTKLVTHPLTYVLSMHKTLDPDKVMLVDVMAT